MYGHKTRSRRKMNTNQPSKPQNASVVLSWWDSDSDDSYETPPPIDPNDWRSIDGLFHVVVEENRSDDARQLRRTFHHLSARCELLTVKKEGFSAVISTQNLTKKRRGALLLSQKKKGRSEALLFSPSKVRTARQQHKLDETKRLEEEVANHHKREESGYHSARQVRERETFCSVCGEAGSIKEEEGRRRRRTRSQTAGARRCKSYTIVLLM